MTLQEGKLWLYIGWLADSLGSLKDVMIPQGVCFMKKLLDIFIPFFNIAGIGLKDQAANKNWPAHFQLPSVLLECEQASLCF